MTGYPPGSLKYGRYVAEVTYGTMPTGTLSWMGDTITAQDTTDYQRTFVPMPDTRATLGVVQSGPYHAGFTAKYYARASNWKTFWATYVLGSTTATTQTLPSFTALFDVYDGTTHNYRVYNGCKVNRGTIRGAGPGKLLEFEVEVLAQFNSQSTTKNLTEVQTVTIGSDPTPPVTSCLSYAAYGQRNINGAGLATWQLQEWSLTVDNHLSREDGHVLNGATYYPCTTALHEGERDIWFEGTLKHSAQTYQDMLKSNTLMTAVTLPIDTDTVTLATGYPAPDMKYIEYGHRVHDERVKFGFTSIAIA